MNHKLIAIIAATALLTGVPTALAAASGPHGDRGRSGTRTVSPLTPSECILLNGGDFNACNVGNSGRGDRPYRIELRHTPSKCILLNGGDFNACNVGNDGRGDLPYRRSR